MAKSKKVKEKEQQQEKNIKSEAPSEAPSEDQSKKIQDLNAMIANLEEALIQAKDESKHASDDALKHLAELENFKKRKQQEVDTFKKYASESVVLEILSILDTFELACQIPEEQKNNETLAQFIQGFALILKQFQQTLERLNVTEVNPINESFDPNLHQAIAQEKKKEYRSNMVISVMQKGYKLHNKLIRPAMVSVSE